MPSGIKRTNKIFIDLSNKIHDNEYAYNKVEYINNLTEVIITCSTHGDFFQLPKCHLRGHGCNKCALVNAANKKVLKSKEKFLLEIKIKDFENRWDYSKVEFTGTNDTITLICNGCNNETTRTPYTHLHHFLPCRRGCFVIKNKEFNLKDNIVDNIVVINENLHTEETLEEWKIFPDNAKYLVSNKGYIKNIKSDKIFNGSLDKISGYMRTAINKETFSIHYMVAKTFLSNPNNKPTVNHKNKDRTNNCVDNLEWATYAEQNEHKNQTSIKQYDSHKNGKTILRINKETNKVIETYDTIMKASKWIMEDIYKTDIANKNIEQELKSISSSLSQKIKRNNNHYFGYNFIWKFEETTIDKNDIWKPLIGIEKDGYFISNSGKIKNPLGKIKEKFGKAGGYYDYKIIEKGKHHKIHRLVALHFIENHHNKPFVNHINGNKFDNRVENLEWATNQENIVHAYKNGLNKEGLSPVIQYDKKGKQLIKEFKSISDASKDLNIDSSCISSCCRGITMQTHGFHFKYKCDDNKDVRDKKPNFTCGKKVYQFDKENNLIKSFNTIKECAFFLKVSSNVILNKINGSISKNAEINNYIFKVEH